MPDITFTVDARVYRLAAIKKTAYRMTDRCHTAIEFLPDGNIRVRLTAKLASSAPSVLEGAFFDELLDQDLRESIAEETERVRNLILAQAFSSVSLTQPDADTADYRNDPLGITRSQAGN